MIAFTEKFRGMALSCMRSLLLASLAPQCHATQGEGVGGMFLFVFFSPLCLLLICNVNSLTQTFREKNVFVCGSVKQFKPGLNLETV